MSDTKAPCHWCVVDGRCVLGEVVWYNGDGRQSRACDCFCHVEARLLSPEDSSEAQA